MSIINDLTYSLDWLPQRFIIEIATIRLLGLPVLERKAEQGSHLSLSLFVKRKNPYQLAIRFRYHRISVFVRQDS